MGRSDLSKHYAVLRPDERLTLVLEAAARGDAAEAADLRGTCPRRTYTAPDRDFALRLEVALEAATVACAALQSLYGQLRSLDWAARAVRTTSDLHHVNAELAFHEGVLRGLGEADRELDGAEEAASLAAVGVRSRQSADAVVALMTRGAKDVATELAVAWAGFDRFCRSRPRVAPQTLLAARGLGASSVDGIRRLLATYATEPPDEGRVREFDLTLAARWDWQFAGEGAAPRSSPSGGMASSRGRS